MGESRRGRTGKGKIPDGREEREKGTASQKEVPIRVNKILGGQGGYTSPPHEKTESRIPSAW